MNASEYKKFLTKYAKEHIGDFCAVHDTHDANNEKGLVNKIENNGLRVSFPIDKESNAHELKFRATFSNITNGVITDFFVAGPKAALLLRIPKELLDINSISNLDSNVYQQFCGFGKQTGNKQDGFNIEPQKYSFNANIRLFPSYLVEGHLNSETGEVIKNPQFFELLNNSQQAIIKEQIQAGKAYTLCDHKTYTNVSTIEPLIQEEVFSKTNLKINEPEISMGR